MKVEDQIVSFSDQVFCRSCYLGRQLGSVTCYVSHDDTSNDTETVGDDAAQCQLCGRVTTIHQRQLFSHLQMYVLDCSEIGHSLSVVWREMPLVKIAPISRTLPSVAVGKGEILIFGGMQNATASNDLVIVSPQKTAH